MTRTCYAMLAALLAAAPLAPALAADQAAVKVAQRPFGETPQGEKARLFTCTNASGAVLQLTDYGARVVSLEVPDRDGKLANIALGFDDLQGYVRHNAYFGCTVGRYANRIAAGRFTLDGKTYKLATNNDPNHLHGGVRGFNRVVWNAEVVRSRGAGGVRFTYTSPDGEEGYPGTLEATAIYTLTSDNELRIEFQAATDAPTVVNLANHAYWNLGGAGSGKIDDHVLMIRAERFVAVDETLIPTGKLVPVRGTPMDFTEPRRIGSRLERVKASPDGPAGYDHCYVLSGEPGTLRLAARAKDPGSGRVMEVYTTQPGVQLYTGNFLDGSKVNGGYPQHAAFCLETQHYPDSPNHPDFPSTVLRPGEKYRQLTVHKFFVD